MPDDVPKLSINPNDPVQLLFVVLPAIIIDSLFFEGKKLYCSPLRS